MDEESNIKKCPYCGEEIKATAKKCRHCKEFLPEETAQVETKHCPYCNGEVASNSKKCKHCGEWLVESEVKNPSKAQSSKRCKFCGSIIPEHAERCPKCREWLVRENNSRQAKNGHGYIVDIIAILAGTVWFALSSDATEIFWGFIITAILVEGYLLPTKIALERSHTQLFLVVAVNLMLGATVIGWLVALAIASAQRRGRNSL